jgi:hypothetical protein
VWIIGVSDNNPVAYLWAGRRWYRISLPASFSLPLVLLGPSNAWIAGNSIRVRKHLVTPLWHWNGSAWKSYLVPIVLNTTESIAGNSDTNLWVAGVQSRRLYSPGWLTVYKWTGSAWQQAPIKRSWIVGPPTISVSWTGDVWIEAYSRKFVDRYHRAIVLHYHGKRWAQLPDSVLPDGGVADFPPTAVGHGIWFSDDGYWNGRTFQLVSFSSHGQCDGIYSSGQADMAEIPGTDTALFAAGCPRNNINGRIQGALFISKHTAHLP